MAARIGQMHGTYGFAFARGKRVSSLLMNPAPANSYQANRADIMRGFTGEHLKPHGVSPMYRLAMCVVTFAMVLLPLVYLAMIAAVGWGVFWYLQHGVVILAEVRSIWGIALFLAPIAAGVAMIFVLIGPLFSERKRGPEPLFVTRGQEPELWALVERICAEVRAPLPRKIAVSCEVNASAGFEPGLLAFLLGRLRLTVGLPLVRGLSLGQLTGVLAHEFGHFSQGGGMRFTYVIRSISDWFARVVYQRGTVDRAVAKLGQTGIGALAIVSLLSQAFLVVGRWVLRGLMMLGHLISSYMLRQMEYDADAWMARVAGSDTLASAMARLPQLDAGAERAWEIVNEFGRANKLPDDVNVLIADASARLPGRARARIADNLACGEQGRFDTHPTHRARIDAAKRLAEPGIFHDGDGAAKLLRDADGLGRETTRHHYAVLAGVEMDKITLVKPEEVLQRNQARAREQECADALFEGLPLQYLNLHMSLQNAAAENSAGSEAGGAAARLRDARAALEAEIPGARASVVRWEKALDAWRTQLLANALFDGGFSGAARKIRGAAGLRSTIDSINELERRTAELDAATTALQPLVPAVSAFVNAAFAQRQAQANKIENQEAREQARAGVRGREDVLRALCSVATDHRKMEETVVAMPSLLNALTSKDSVTQDELNLAITTVDLGVNAGNRCAKAFEGMACPFDESHKGATMHDFLLTGNDPAAHEVFNNTRLVGHLYTQMNEAMARIAGWLAATEA